MKRIFSLMAACLLTGATSFAASRYWIGPSNGNWNNSDNWSDQSEGAGGASVPGVGNDVFFERDALVQLDIAPVIASLSVSIIKNVTLYTNSASSITISGSLQLAPGSVLKDSTSQPVAFPVIFDPATEARGEIYGNWIFAGNPDFAYAEGSGAGFIAAGKAKVTVYGRVFGSGEGRIITRQNAGTFNSTLNTLAFMAGAYFVSEDDLSALIPDATWDKSSTLLISGNANLIKHLGSAPSYGFVTIDLPRLSSDVSFDLPSGSEIKNLFSITNTNAHTLTILAASGTDNKVSAILRSSFSMSGSQTNVAMATAPASAPQSAYQLAISLDFLQSGGNFSLQDFNNVTGSSTLIIGRDLKETSGTFITKSTATGSASFVVDMDFNYGGVLRYDADQVIKMSSGSIDNGQNMVTLRLDSKTDYTGVTLQSPLSTGKAEFIGGPLTTTSTNILTINNTDAQTAVKTGTRNGYVNGPLKVTTNSTASYILPTGKNSTKMSPAYLVPTSSALSVYKAEYFRTGYSDLTTLAVPLSGISKDRYWNLEKVSGSDASVQLVLNGSIDGAKNNDVIVVAHYGESGWTSEQGGFIMPGTSSTGSVSSKPLNSYSAFTFGYISAVGGALPVRIVSFSAAKLNNGASIAWKAEEIPASFEVQRSIDGRNYITIATLQGMSTKAAYNYFDAAVPTGSVYYRLRSIEKDGTATYSGIAMINNKDQAGSMISMAPTAVRSQATLNFSAFQAGRLEVFITDMLGRNCKQLELFISAGSTQSNVDLSSLKAGVYQLNGVVNGEAIQAVRFVKL